MSKVFVVDDEQRYRDLISHVLASEGHETRTAAGGREALDLAARYRPDVLVTDWMLKDDIHGLHVVEVLRAVLPDVRAIMMTGFPSADLRKGAHDVGVHVFLEKPFDAKCVQAAVREATAPGKTTPPSLPLAMMEIDSVGSIVFANSAAKAMMDETLAGRDAGNLAALLSDEMEPALQAAMDRWVVLLPRSGGHKRWHLRSQEPLEDGSRLIVLRRWDEPHYLGLALVEMLLSSRDAKPGRWPFDDRVLIVDDQALLRAMVVSILEGAGAGCYAVATADEALRLLEQDEELRFVLLDFEMPNTDTRSLIQKIKAARPDVTIVGNSGSDHRDDFASMGVKHYLEKPWRIDDLVNQLAGTGISAAAVREDITDRRLRPPDSKLCL